MNDTTGTLDEFGRSIAGELTPAELATETAVAEQEAATAAPVTDEMRRELAPTGPEILSAGAISADLDGTRSETDLFDTGEHPAINSDPGEQPDG